MLKKSTSGPDLGQTAGFAAQSRSYHVIDVEGGGGASGGAARAGSGGESVLAAGGERGGSPLSKRHGAAPSPHAGGGAASAGPGPGSGLGTGGPLNGGGYSAASTPLPPSAAARRQRSLQAAAGASYVVSSAALILLNKKALVHYSFRAVHALLFYHCACVRGSIDAAWLQLLLGESGWEERQPSVSFLSRASVSRTHDTLTNAHTPSTDPTPRSRRLAVVIARAIAALGWGRIEPLTWQVARLWLPVNIIFVAMLATNFYALKTVVSWLMCSCACMGWRSCRPGAAAAARCEFTVHQPALTSH
jgi:hypothetical protein